MTLDNLHMATFLLIAISCSGSYWTLQCLSLPFNSWNNDRHHCRAVFEPWMTVSLGVVAATSAFNACFVKPLHHIVCVLVSYLALFCTFLLMFWTIVVVTARNCFSVPNAYGIHVSWTALLLALCLVSLAQRPRSSWGWRDNAPPPLEPSSRSVESPAATAFLLEAATTTVGGEGLRCAICLCDFSTAPEEDQAVVLACSHRYHTQCLGSWLSRSNSCPECRRQVVVRGLSSYVVPEDTTTEADRRTTISPFRFSALWSLYS